MAIRNFFIVASIAIGTCASASAALDLTATQEEYVTSGMVFKRLVFQDGGRRVEMEFPKGWNFRVASPARLELTPPGKGFATAVIQTQPAGAGAIDEAALNGAAQEAVSMLPPGSQGATIERVKVDPDGSGGGDVTLSYKNLGYTFRRNIRLVNLPACRLITQISAPEAEFPALHATFWRAVQSLSWN